MEGEALNLVYYAGLAVPAALVGWLLARRAEKPWLVFALVFCAMLAIMAYGASA